MKTKSTSKKARVPTAADLRILAAGAQAAAKRAKADKASVKSAKKTFKLAKLALKQSRLQAKASARLAKQSKKAWKAALAEQPKDRKSSQLAGKKVARKARPKTAASKMVAKASRPPRKGNMAQRMRRAPRITTPTLDSESRPTLPTTMPPAPVEVIHPVTGPAESTGAAASRPPVPGVAP